MCCRVKTWRCVLFVLYCAVLYCTPLYCIALDCTVMCSKYVVVSIFLPMYALLYLCTVYFCIYVSMYLCVDVWADGGVDVCTKCKYMNM